MVNFTLVMAEEEYRQHNAKPRVLTMTGFTSMPTTGVEEVDHLSYHQYQYPVNFNEAQVVRKL
ncbi:hypothetical protein DPV78_011690 [Talaromyces pinophilus]|nr:hypothetical protein DPV78_011690 [Talaromyces pinophilus]